MFPPIVQALFLPSSQATLFLISLCLSLVLYVTTKLHYYYTFSFHHQFFSALLLQKTPQGQCEAWITSSSTACTFWVHHLPICNREQEQMSESRWLPFLQELWPCMRAQVPFPQKGRQGGGPERVLSCGNMQQFGLCDCVPFSDKQNGSARNLGVSGDKRLNLEVSQGTSSKLECWNHDHGEKITETTCVKVNVRG